MELLQKINEMPLLTHAIASFKKRGSPDFCPNLTFLMRNENEYSLYVNKMIVESVVAEDIPLAHLKKYKRRLKKKSKKDIYSGYTHSNLDIQFIMQKEKEINRWLRMTQNVIMLFLLG